MKTPWYLRVTSVPIVPIILGAGAILVFIGQTGFGQQFIALPLLFGLAIGRLFRVDHEPI